MRRPAGPLRAERRPRVRRAKPRPAFKVWRELEPVPSPRSRLKEAGTATYSKGLCGRALISRARVVNQLFHWIGSAKGRGLANPHEAPRPLQQRNILHARRSCGANSAAGLRACRDDVTASSRLPGKLQVSASGDDAIRGVGRGVAHIREISTSMSALPKEAVSGEELRWEILPCSHGLPVRETFLVKAQIASKRKSRAFVTIFHNVEVELFIKEWRI